MGMFRPLCRREDNVCHLANTLCWVQTAPCRHGVVLASQSYEFIVTPCADIIDLPG